jgi:glycosyltransferase involved in cell wall biosynthesis
MFASALPAEGSLPGGAALSLSRRLYGLAGGKSAGPAGVSGFDVFHSAGASMVENIPWIVDNDVRWVVDFEHVGSLVGYYGDWRSRLASAGARRVLTKQLSSRYCRKLMPWTDAAKRGLKAVLPDLPLDERAEVVRLSMRPAPRRPDDIEEHGAVRILFIGSVNFGGEFWSKGGFEALESYRLLRERYGEAVEMYFRCWMPDELRSTYASVPGLHVLSGLLPRDELDRLFWSSDIFLFPAHNSPGLAFLEAMRFGLPIVGKDLWSNRETVVDGVTGFLVEPSRRVPYLLPGEVPNWGGDDTPFVGFMRQRDDVVVASLVDRLSKLVDDPALRRRMGDAGRYEIETGKASIGRRNAQLRRIYEEAARR